VAIKFRIGITLFGTIAKGLANQTQLDSSCCQREVSGFKFKTRRKFMATRTSSAVWEGNLKEGKGTMKVGRNAYEGPFSFASRFENGTGTNPEELIGAAEAGCFSMALSNGLTKAGHTPKRISTTAKVNLEMIGGGPKITSIELDTEGEVPGIDEAKFKEIAEETKKACPVSVALSGTEIKLNARLKS
jgi:lipoyl-dependent peroxiredoxin